MILTAALIVNLIIYLAMLSVSVMAAHSICTKSNKELDHMTAAIDRLKGAQEIPTRKPTKN